MLFAENLEYLEAWVALDHWRPPGGLNGPSRISLEAVFRWADANGFDLEEFIDMMAACEDIYAQHIDEMRHGGRGAQTAKRTAK